ncbi:hypothetical protein CAOG_07545 [Capsaspora owczarzaki ATCC 30864]|uniref:Uncharacterized protein n=1 Tax=Capsaspora owczarzaki (strain ATCC 30864) TaxID=595528 RepID=A0A0D2WWU1_CAPO3|nr:hypothetical protein CAOG_07545 [Capsaspora owczarzaki ATCC 30864]KJE97063.1 hypothetical protein CAOG_007545 [Capsaspora owczarzaki ATCC 30864]|eukprot:XP_004343419.2 hypothetical protein CAOG_07545 [Capsaspora owczarzaki ATCC 30864]
MSFHSSDTIVVTEPDDEDEDNNNDEDDEEASVAVAEDDETEGGEDEDDDQQQQQQLNGDQPLHATTTTTTTTTTGDRLAVPSEETEPAAALPQGEGAPLLLRGERASSRPPSFVLPPIEGLSIYQDMEAAFERALQRVRASQRPILQATATHTTAATATAVAQAGAAAQTAQTASPATTATPATATATPAAATAISASSITSAQSQSQLDAHTPPSPPDSTRVSTSREDDGGGGDAELKQQPTRKLSNATTPVETSSALGPAAPALIRRSGSSQSGLAALAVVSPLTSPALARALIGVAPRATQSSLSLTAPPERSEPRLSALEILQSSQASISSRPTSPTSPRRPGFGRKSVSFNNLAVHAITTDADERDFASKSPRQSVSPSLGSLSFPSPSVATTAAVSPPVSPLPFHSQSQQKSAVLTNDTAAAPDSKQPHAEAITILAADGSAPPAAHALAAAETKASRTTRTRATSVGAVKPLMLSPAMMGTKKTLTLSRAERTVLPTFAPAASRAERWRSLPTPRQSLTPTPDGQQSPSASPLALSNHNHDIPDFARRGSLLLPWNPRVIADAKRQVDTLQRTVASTRVNVNDARFRMRETTVLALACVDLDPNRKRAEISIPWSRKSSSAAGSPTPSSSALPPLSASAAGLPGSSSASSSSSSSATSASRLSRRAKAGLSVITNSFNFSPSSSSTTNAASSSSSSSSSSNSTGGSPKISRVRSASVSATSLRTPSPVSLPPPRKQQLAATSQPPQLNRLSSSPYFVLQSQQQQQQQQQRRPPASESQLPDIRNTPGANHSESAGVV